MRRADFTRNKLKLEDVQKQLKQDFSLVAQTEEGKEVLRFILKRCGFHESSTSLDPTSKDVLIHSMILDEGRRNLWLEIRKLIPYELLVKIEMPEPPPIVETQEENEDGTGTATATI